MRLFCRVFLLTLISSSTFAYEVTVSNQSPQTPSHGPVLIFRNFDSTAHKGKVEYLVSTIPATYKQKPSEIFNAYSAFHTLSEDFGRALIAPSIITVGNKTAANGKQNFVIELAGRQGKTRIGPTDCSIDKNRLCYEIPTTVVGVTVDGKKYPELVDSGKLMLPKGDRYKVNLMVMTTVKEVSVKDYESSAKNASKQSLKPVDAKTNL